MFPKHNKIVTVVIKKDNKIKTRKAYRSNSSWWVHPKGKEGCWLRKEDSFILNWIKEK